VWEDADTFNPARFLDDEGRLVRKECFIPVGIGRPLLTHMSNYTESLLDELTYPRAQRLNDSTCVRVRSQGVHGRAAGKDGAAEDGRQFTQSVQHTERRRPERDNKMSYDHLTGLGMVSRVHFKFFFLSTTAVQPFHWPELLYDTPNDESEMRQRRCG